VRTYDEIAEDVDEASRMRDAESLRSLAKDLKDLGTIEAEVLATIAEGSILRQSGEYERALEFYMRAVDMSEEVGIPSAGIWNNIGSVYSATGDYTNAFKYFDRAAEAYQVLGQKDKLARTVSNIGIVYARIGDFPSALEQFEKAAAGHEEVGDIPSLAFAINNIGVVYEHTGDYPRAMDKFRQALALNTEIGSQFGEAAALANMGLVYKSEGDHESAVREYQRALDLLKETGDLASPVAIMTNMVGSLLRLGEIDRASLLLQDDALKHSTDPQIRATVLSHRATLHSMQGDLDSAHATFLEALATADEAGLRADSAAIHMELRDLAHDRNDFEGYIRHNSEYQRITDEIHGREATQKMAMMEAQRGIEAERRQREKERALLYGALPENVANRILRGETVEDQFEYAAVLFSDVVSFTTHSSAMNPSDMIKLLADLYRDFDAFCAEHGVVKVKTIGDSYLCFKGDSTAAENAAAVASVALSMQQHSATWPSGEPLTHRIGIHCGPISAGVIGTQRLQYDIWGDTVNVASRMESHAEAGRIQVSENVVEQLQGAFPVVERGVIEVKGKGTMKTYWLGPR